MPIIHVPHVCVTPTGDEVNVLGALWQCDNCERVWTYRRQIGPPARRVWSRFSGQVTINNVTRTFKNGVEITGDEKDEDD